MNQCLSHIAHNNSIISRTKACMSYEFSRCYWLHVYHIFSCGLCTLRIELNLLHSRRDILHRIIHRCIQGIYLIVEWKVGQMFAYPVCFYIQCPPSHRCRLALLPTPAIIYDVLLPTDIVLLCKYNYSSSFLH